MTGWGEGVTTEREREREGRVGCNNSERHLRGGQVSASQSNFDSRKTAEREKEVKQRIKGNKSEQRESFFLGLKCHGWAV